MMEDVQMQLLRIFDIRNKRLLAGLVAILLLSATAVFADPGDIFTTPVQPMELPVEVEVETGPASLKQAPLWKELYQLLEEPYGEDGIPGTADDLEIERRPGFGVVMPDLNVWPLDYNFLTGQPLRLRTNNGEVSWELPGPMFDPDEMVATDVFNVPTELRSIIGSLVTDSDVSTGNLVVSNPDNDPRLPPDGTIIAVPAVVDGALQELAAPSSAETEDVEELEIPVNEEDFFRDPLDTQGVDANLQPFIGRLGAEVLGKALFWDMQVGSDGVQACGTCHFSAGVDSRVKNQLNPDTLGGDNTLQVAGPNEEVEAGDFPFHKLADPDIPGEPLLNPDNVISDSNDVMSSMGVSRFTQFVDIPAIGTFLPAVNGVAALPPDLGNVVTDPVPAFIDPETGENLRRVEPRNTPTFHGAAFNLDNFWDGRARFVFNGGSVFGAADPQFHIFIDETGLLEGASMGDLREDLLLEDPEVAEQPLRIKFSSLASQAVGPPLNDFEMSFAGRNWPKIGKKLLQSGVTPLANQLVATDDSRLGPFSNQGGAVCAALGRPTAAGMPGLCVSYPELIQIAYVPEFWLNDTQHLDGAPDASDPFDLYSLTVADGDADPANTNDFTQMEANFSTFFALGVQAYESLTIPDDTPFDRFMDANPLAANGIGQPGEQAVLFPTLIRDLLGGSVTLIEDDPTTPEYDGFGPEELLGMDIFMGGNLTAALPPGAVGTPGGPGNRNPTYEITNENGDTVQISVGSNPFARTARCMLCHLGPEQTDHSINISHGLLKGDAEFEFPTPPFVADPGAPDNCVFSNCLLPAPEPPGTIKAVGGLILAEEVEETPQDAVEVEPRNFATLDDPATPWDDRVVAQPGRFSFGDQGIYNLGLRPNSEDIGRGGLDPFNWPLSLATLTLKNIGGPLFEPGTLMANYDPFDPEATFEESGDGFPFPGTALTLQSINPGLERGPINPLMPEYMAPWINALPAGELHPSIDEQAGFAPNTLTPPNGGPAVEFTENMFGSDVHCGLYDPAQFGSGPPNFGWGPTIAGASACPNPQSGVAGNMEYPIHGSWPDVNQVLADGAFKAPALRNVELTGPYFHTGSYLTLRQVVDFYMRGGDFPITNAADRDPHILDVDAQIFGFGRSSGADLGDVNIFINGFQLLGNFADALPDTIYQYDAMPDIDHPLTPEYLTPEEAKQALVRFLLAMTDPRTKYERAPFDHPELFVPMDGTSPENTDGRTELETLSGTPCSAATTGNCFQQIPAVGAGGVAAPVPNFLDISNTPVDGPNNDHFDR
jgi:cytochrome c peroxidase